MKSAGITIIMTVTYDVKKPICHNSHYVKGLHIIEKVVIGINHSNLVVQQITLEFVNF